MFQVNPDIFIIIFFLNCDKVKEHCGGMVS